MWTHVIVAHAVLVPVLLAALSAVIAAALRLEPGVRSRRRLADPLDLELVRHWNGDRP